VNSIKIAITKISVVMYIRLNGQFDRADVKEIEVLKNTVSNSTAEKVFIFDFTEMEEFCKDIIPPLLLCLAEARKKGTLYSLSSKQIITDSLLSAGVIRRNELFNTKQGLAQALKNKT
jgi:hypothetical protein